ncbi:MAG: hypothetical protein Kow00109_28310 [Acidobacteriota bacterium]
MVIAVWGLVLQCAVGASLGPFAAISAPAAPSRWEFHENLMGTEFRIVIHAADRSAAHRAALRAFRRIEELEERLSDYREDSELSLAVQNAAAEPVILSADLFQALSTALRWAYRSRGALDPTVKPVARLWKEALQSGKTPAAEVLERACRRVGFRKVLLNPRTRSLKLTEPGVELDLGALGKGFAADAAWEVLREEGFPHSLVDAGGDVRLGFPPPGRPCWHVKVPEALLQGGALCLRSGAVATSGDTLQGRMIEGRWYSHLLDASTCRPVDFRTTVTVVAADATTADALATVFAVAPMPEVVTVAGAAGVEVALLRSGTGGVQRWTSPGLRALTVRAE